MVKDFGETFAWYQRRLGLLISDEIVMDKDGQEQSLGAFTRCNRGEEYVDHHTVFFINAGHADFNHAAFEVANWDVLMQSHYSMKKAGHQHSFGVGKHILGSQTFDYWKDPNGFMLEHFTDGDLFNGRRKGRTTHCCRRRHRRRRAHAHAEHHQHHDDLAEEVRRKDSIGCETVETKDCSLEQQCILHAGAALLLPFFFPRFSKHVIQIFPGNAAWTIQPRSLFSARLPKHGRVTRPPDAAATSVELDAERRGGSFGALAQLRFRHPHRRHRQRPRRGHQRRVETTGRRGRAAGRAADGAHVRDAEA